MAIEIAHAPANTKFHKLIPVVLLSLWTIAGLAFYVKGGCKVFTLPFLLFAWWLGVLAWICARRWKLLAVVIAPVLAVVACFASMGTHSAYTNWIADREFRGFIVNTSQGTFLSHYSYYEVEPAEAQADFSSNYSIEYQEIFIGLHEWIVLFPNGSRYYITVPEFCDGTPTIGAEKYEGN
jgi:hypothetical protein